MVGAIVGAAAAIGGAVISSNAAGDAADAQSAAADRATAAQLKMYDQTRQDLSPYNTTGSNAMYSLGNLFGLANDKTNPASGTDPNAAGTVNSALATYQASPEYQFSYQQGLQALDRSAAAKGGLLSGGQLKAAQQYGQGYATNTFGDYVNRLMGLAGIGENAAAQTGAYGTETGKGVASNALYAGNAQASGAIAQGNAWSNALSQIGSSVYGGYGG